MTGDAAGRPAVFLDRDGTINQEKEYLFRPEEFEFIPGAVEAIRLLKNAGFLVIVVTNQSGIGRGYYGEEELSALHRHLDELLQEECAAIDAYYFCPHHPEHGIEGYRTECDCRKPLPGMLLQAASDLSIDLCRSFMVGDKAADVEAGVRAGCRSFLVRTGYGWQEEALLPQGTPVCNDLLAAARLIVAEVEVRSDCRNLLVD